MISKTGFLSKVWRGSATLSLIGLLAGASLACNVSIAGVVPVLTPRPAVVFLAPDPNSTIAEGATVQIAVDVADSSGPGVTRVDFAVDGLTLGSAHAPALSGQARFTALQIWTASGEQGHLIDATAYRADNTVVGDASLTVKVAPIVVTASYTPTPTVSEPFTPPPTLPPSITIITIAAFVTPNTATPLPPGASPAPGVGTPVTAPSGTPTGPVISVLAPNLNVRSGPGTNYPVIGSLKTDEVVSIVGRNTDSSWWVIQSGALRGWVINTTVYVQVSGDTSKIPLVAAPPSPIPTLATPTAIPALIPTSTRIGG